MLELQAARTSLPQALKFLWRRNCNGIRVAGLAVLGLTTFFIFFFHFEWRLDFNRRYDHCLETLAGFSLGAESIALFARVGGGIYTKRPCWADLEVGKVASRGMILVISYNCG
jgi:K(+)-stimulated pyrophosphate-energized sodium pump